MKDIKKYLQEFRNQFEISGIVTFVVGLLLLIYPGFTGKAICTLIAGILLAKGVHGVIVQYRAAGNTFVPFTMMGNITICLMGLFVFVRSDLIISIIPFIFGLFLLLSGISSLQKAFTLKNMNYPGWNHGLIFTVIKVILAAVVVMNPFGTAMTLTRFIGACLVYDGASGMITLFETIKAKSAFEKAQDNLRSMNLNKDDGKDEYIPTVEAEFVEIVKEIKTEKK